MIFYQILTKFDQIWTIYIKNHQIHVKKFQGRHFPREKSPCGNVNTSHRGWGGGYWGIGVWGYWGGYWGKNNELINQLLNAY